MLTANRRSIGSPTSRYIRNREAHGGGAKEGDRVVMGKEMDTHRRNAAIGVLIINADNIVTMP